jgi:hypothetical protein
MDPDEQAAAMDQLTAMLLSIGNDTKRAAYIKQICDLNKTACKTKDAKAAPLPERDLKKSVAEEQKRRTAADAKKKMDAEFSKNIQTATDAGLPEDFKGDRKDIMDALKYGVYVHDNVYYSRGAKGADYAVSNFTMRILYHVDTSDEQAFRLIAVKNVYGFDVVINMNTDDFVTIGSFRKVLARRGDFIFKGTDSDLTRLQEFLQRDEIKTVYIKTLGYHPRGQFWAWANGIMPLTLSPLERAGGEVFIATDEHGIVPFDNRNYFIPACSKMYREKDEMFVNEKKFVYTHNSQLTTHNFSSWASIFYKAYGKKSIPAILFYIGSIFRDIIMKQVQRYPLLNLFGPPGAGKGQMAESLMAMFGERQDQIMLGGASTVVGFMRKFAQFRNAIVWLDEYKNNLPVKFIESFKNIYDGKGYERGKMTNDFTTESTPIHSSCILSGQDMPTQEPALFMRVIMLAFEEGKFTNTQRENFQLLKDAEAAGLSVITAELFRYRSAIQENFKQKLDVVFKEALLETANNEIDDRMIMNISILLTIMHILTTTNISVESAGGEVFPFSYREAKTFLIENMRHQHAVLAGNNDVAKFWGVVESMFAQDIIIEDHDFALEDGYIYLRLMQVHPLYVKELKQRGDNNFLSKSTLEHYLKLDNTVFVDYVRKRFKDGSNNWCYKMKYARLAIDLIKIKPDHAENNEQFKARAVKRYQEMGVNIEDPVTGDEANPF